MDKPHKHLPLSPRKQKLLKFKENKVRQKETYNFTKRFYRFLKNHSSHIFFKKLSGKVGLYDHETKDITVDHRRDFLSTLIHEYLHHIHPSWSETNVLTCERKIINSLTIRQIKNILKALANVI